MGHAVHSEKPTPSVNLPGDVAQLARVVSERNRGNDRQLYVPVLK